MVQVEGLPFGLEWLGAPQSWSLEDAVLTIEAGPRSDWFVDPGRELAPAANAPALVGAVAGDYQLSARVTVAFAATFDAGVLMLHADDRTWAKLCFEYSPQRVPMVVSVVTDGVSDDANAWAVDGATAWLRIARRGPSYAFHASRDGRSWDLVRVFALPDGAEPRIGFEAQSPTGDGCAVRFDQIHFTAERLADLRDGG